MRGMFATSDLIGPLADRGINLSRSQVYRLVAEPPERVSLSMLLALVDILECQFDRARSSRRTRSEPGGHASQARQRRRRVDRSEAAIEFDPAIVLRAMTTTPRVVCIDCGRLRMPHKRIEEGRAVLELRSQTAPARAVRALRSHPAGRRPRPGRQRGVQQLLPARPEDRMRRLRPDPRRRRPHPRRRAVPNLQAFRPARVVWHLRTRRHSPRPRPRRATDVSALLGRPGPAVRALRHRRTRCGSGHRRTRSARAASMRCWPTPSDAAIAASSDRTSPTSCDRCAHRALGCGSSSSVQAAGGSSGRPPRAESAWTVTTPIDTPAASNDSPSRTGHTGRLLPSGG